MTLKKCVKCGGKDIYIHYIEEGEYFDDTYSGWRKGRAEKECLYHQCKTCSFWWIEDPLDSNKGREVK